MILDEFLFPKDSPYSQNKGQTSGYAFDYENEAGIISSSKIRNAAIGNAQIGTAAIGTANIGTITFGQIDGGTANFGGPANGDGVVHVNDAGGTTRITLDNSGILVTNGNIIIQNDAGGTVLDNEGINSVTSFPSDQVVNSTGYNTTSTSYTDVTGSSLDAFTLTRPTKVLIIIQVQGKNDDFVGSSYFAGFECTDSVDGSLVTFNMGCDYWIDGFTEDGSGFITGYSVSTFYKFFSISVIQELAAGSHVLKLRFRAEGGGTADIGTYILSYVILGS